MAEQENIQVVQQAYAAWQRGDIRAVLDTFTDDVDWLVPGPTDIIPHAGQWRGHERMAEYFSLLDQTLEFEQYELEQFVAQGDSVVVRGRSRVRARPTGHRYEDAFAHWFELRGGKIARMRYYDDTAAAVAALTMPKTSARAT